MRDRQPLQSPRAQRNSKATATFPRTTNEIMKNGFNIHSTYAENKLNYRWGYNERVENKQNLRVRAIFHNRVSSD